MTRAPLPLLRRTLRRTLRRAPSTAPRAASGAASRALRRATAPVVVLAVVLGVAAGAGSPPQPASPGGLELVAYNTAPPPANLRVAVGHRTLTASWDRTASGDGPESYDVTVRRPDGSTVETKSVNEPAATAPAFVGLVNGTTYRVLVRVTTRGGFLGLGTYTSPWSAEVTATPRPAAPTGLAATPGDNRVALTWTRSADAGITDYDVSRGGTVVGTVSAPTGTPTFTDTGLTNGTALTYTVRAVDRSTTPSTPSAASAPLTTTPLDTVAPSAVTGLQASGSTDGSGRVVLSWTPSASADASRTRVQRDGSLVADLPAASTGWTDAGRTVGTALSYAVVVVDDDGLTSSPATASATPTDVVAPAVPTGLVAVRGDGRVELSWTASTEDDLASYQVVRDGAVVATVTAPATGHTDTGLTNDTTYRYALRAVDTRGNASAASSPAVSATPTDLTRPATPTGLVAVRGDGRVELTWTANVESDLSHYLVVRNGSVLATVTAPTARYTDTAVTNDDQYRYALVAVDTHGNASALSSPPVRATPTDLTPPAAPTGLVATRGDGRADLAWTPNAETDLASYRVLRDGATVATVEAPTTSWADTGLTNDRTYAYALVAVDTHDNPSAASAPPVPATPTDLTPPAVPTGVVASAGERSVVVRWNAVTTSDLGSYEVLRDGAVVASVAAPTTSFTDSGLVPGTAHRYAVRAVDTHANASAASAPPVSATPYDTTAPAVPSGLAAAAGDGLVVLSWTPNGEGDLAGYDLYRDGVRLAGAPLGASATGHTDTGLTNDRTYAYALRARDTTGNASAPSAAVSATPTDLTPPAAPGTPSAVRGDGVVTLSWAPNGEADLASYVVLRDGAQVASVAAPATTFTDAGLTNDTAVTYALRAVDTHGNTSPTSGSVSATPTDLTPPSPPAQVTADRGDGRVQVAWTPSPEADTATYAVLRDGVQVGTVTAPTTSFTDTGLVNDTSHGYAVRAVDAHGNGSAASAPEVRATPTDLTPPAAPTGLTTAAGDGRVDLAWDPGTEPDLVSYNVYRGGALVGSTAHPVTTWSDTGLANGVAHAYAVTAVDGHGNESPASVSGSGTALDAVAPAAPGAPTAVPADGRVVLTWPASPEGDLAGYRVLRDGVLVQELGAGTTTWTDTGLVNGDVHQYRVVAVDTSANRSTPSAALAAAAADAVVPGAPTAVTATPGQGSATVRWTAPADADLRTYRVLRADGSLAATVAAPATSVVVTGLVDGTAVTLTVVVVDTSGNTSAASASVTTTPVGSSPPAGGSGQSGALAVTRDGRWLVVATTARLEPADTNSASELYRVDTTGQVPPRRPAPLGTGTGTGTATQDTNDSDAALSDDGRYVVLSTTAKLVAADTNTLLDVYRGDLSTTPTTWALVSVPESGAVSPSTAGTLLQGGVSVSARSPGLAVSADGRRVLFYSARDLVGGTTATTPHAYAKDLTTADPSRGPVTRASTAKDGGALPRVARGPALALTPDGRFAVFTAGSGGGPVVAYRKDLGTGTAASSAGPAVVASASRPDLNGQQTEVGASTDTGDVAVSDDGRYVAFSSTAKLATSTPGASEGQGRAWRKDLQTAAVVALGNGQTVLWEHQVALSSDGSVAVFTTAAGQVTADTNQHTDVYRRDLSSGAGTVVLVSSTASGAATPWVGTSSAVLAEEHGRVALLRDGSVVMATHQPLVPGDTNRVRDVYRKDLGSGAVAPLVTG